MSAGAELPREEELDERSSGLVAIWRLIFRGELDEAQERLVTVAPEERIAFNFDATATLLGDGLAEEGMIEVPPASPTFNRIDQLR